MFIAHKDNYIPAIFDGEMFFSSLELPAFTPWFMCDVPQFEENSDEAIFTSTFLIGDVDKLSEFACNNKIEKTYMVSPGHMSKTDSWSLVRLKSVALATYTHEEFRSSIYRYETEVGQFFDQDLSGLMDTAVDLNFQTILKFD